MNDERARKHHHSLTVAGFYPSLHLNLARDYQKLGDLPRAREHLAAARSSTSALADDGYGTMIRSGISRLAGELGHDLRGRAGALLTVPARNQVPLKEPHPIRTSGLGIPPPIGQSE
jgi:hypothetical protein